MEWVFAGVVILGVLSHWLAWRLKLPAILFLLLIGILAGPVAGVVRPDQVFADALFPMVSLSVAVILFEGSLTLRWTELRGIGTAVWGLVTVGAAMTTVAIAFFAHLLIDAPWPVALLIGALCSVTGPTVVVPMLRAIRPKPSVSNALRWEGIIIDPIGAMVAVLVFEYILTRTAEGLWLPFGKLLAAGLCSGLLAAFVLAALLRRHLVPWYLRNVVALAFVLACFVAANNFAHEAGLLAVVVMGMALANMKQISVDDILDFKESLTLLLVAVLFITLAARIDFRDFAALTWGLPFFLIAVFVIRPIAVFASTLLSKLSLNEKLLMSWIAPRGIVAAAVASLFALDLQARGVDGAQLLVPAVFSVIIATVVLQSATAGRVARVLGLSNPEPKGVIIVGASAVNRAFAAKLKERGFTVTLADTVWADVSAGRMAGFDTYYGRIVSDHAEHNLDLSGVGYLFAMSQRRDQNTLACVHFRPELGTHAVFALRSDEERSNHMQKVSGHLRVTHLFGKDFTFSEWERLYAEGAEFRVTKLSETFGMKEYRESIPGDFIPLIGIDPRGRLVPWTEDGRPTLRAGWQLLSLIPKATLEAEARARAAAREAKAKDKAGGRDAPTEPNGKPVTAPAPAGG
jgi:NhaP-type Na+/H+ or K+/H+ antiporter